MRGRVVLTVPALGALATAWIALALHEFAWPWQWAVVAAALSHYLMWAAPVGLGCAVLARRRLVTAGSALACALVLFVQVPPLNLAGVIDGGAARFTVAQANLHVGQAEPAAVVRLVRGHRVTLLATEELTDAEQRRLVAAGLSTLLPHHFTAPLPGGGGGLGIWSRYPLSRERNLPGYQLGVLIARVERPGAPFTAVAVHLLPPYPYSAGTWRAEIARLHTVLAGLAGPVVVPGDFNATVDHAQFRDLLDHGYADAAEQSGSGYLPTYPNDRWYGPVIGIDHVLCRGAYAYSVDTYGVPGSDHRALVARLAG